MDALLIRADACWPGSHSNGTTIIRHPGSPTPEDKIELTALATLRHAGAVLTVPADQMPDRLPIAATLRY